MPSMKNRSAPRSSSRPAPILPNCTGELSDFRSPLWLVCGACGRRGRYEVGAVIILPEYFEKRRARDDAGAMGGMAAREAGSPATQQQPAHAPAEGDQSTPPAAARHMLTPRTARACHPPAHADAQNGESMPSAAHACAEDGESMPRAADNGESLTRGVEDGESMPPDESVLPGEIVPPDALDEHVGFTRYFRCKHCDAGGPWRLPAYTRTQVLIGAAADAILGRDSGVHVARPLTFDRQVALTPTAAEAIIREHLSREPDSSHLWTRLGNVYKAGRRPDLARPAYEKALELDPANIDAHMMLAQALEERHATRLALKHWLAVLKHARNATGTPREERLSMVSAALDGALTLARDPNKAFKSLLEHDDKGDAAASDEPLVLHVQELDLGDPDDWNAICCTFLGEPLAPAHRRPRRRLRSPQTARFEPPPVEPAAWRDDDAPATVFDDHPPRNAPCPCGSGKKYKKCCGAARQAPATAGRALKEWVS